VRFAHWLLAGGRRPAIVDFERREKQAHQNDEARDYRHGSPVPSWSAKRASVRLQELTEAGRRAQYAKGLARAAFGRFFWDDELGRRMAKETDRSYRLSKEQSGKDKGKQR
jgi:hypothetical protein